MSEDVSMNACGGIREGYLRENVAWGAMLGVDERLGLGVAIGRNGSMPISCRNSPALGSAL